MVFVMPSDYWFLPISWIRIIFCNDSVGSIFISILSTLIVSKWKMGTKYVQKSAKYKTSVKDPGTPGVLEMVLV